MAKSKKEPVRSEAERNALVVQWRWLVPHVVKRLLGYACVKYLGFDDAVGQGYLALIRAADLWDPERLINGKPTKFVTYAYRTIRTQILRYAMDETSLIHVPPYLRQERYLDSPYQDDACRAQSWLSLNGLNEFFNDIADHRKPEDSLLALEELEILARVLARLDGRERLLLERYYLEGLTLGEIADTDGVSKEMIRQRLVAAMKQARIVARRVS